MELCDRHPVPGRSTCRDDSYIRSGRKFLLQHRARETPAEREELFWEQPGLYYAYEVYERMPSDAVPALILQARLLAQQTPVEIAASCGMLPEAISWYEALFFNVTPRINCRDWITKQVLLPALSRRFDRYVDDDEPSRRRGRLVSPPFVDSTLKLFAYFGGKYLVDLMLTGFGSGAPLDSVENLAPWLDRHWSAMLKRRSLQAAHQLEVHQHNIMQLFEVNIRLMELEKSAESLEQTRTEIEKAAQALIEELPMAVGDAGRASIAGTALEPYEDGASELRDDELHMVSAGLAPAGFRETLPLALPPPRKPNRPIVRTEEA